MTTTFYTIHAYNRTEDKKNIEDLWENSPIELYETFDEACNEMEKRILNIIDVYNTTLATEEIFFEAPEREELTDFQKEIVYYTFDKEAFVFKIRKYKLVSKREASSCDSCEDSIQWKWYRSPFRLEVNKQPKKVWARYCEECYKKDMIEAGLFNHKN